MKFFSFFDHELNQRAMKPIFGEGMMAICVCIVTILSPLQEAKYDAILLPD